MSEQLAASVPESVAQAYEDERIILNEEGIADAVREWFTDPPRGSAIAPTDGDIVISPSQIGTWSTCRLKWWFEKVAKLDRKPKLSLRWGSGLHKILEEHNKGAPFNLLFSDIPHSGEWSPTESDSEAVEIARNYLGDVPDIDVDKEVVHLVETAKTYVEWLEPARQEFPEEDATVYLFTLPGPVRVFVRGITDFKTERTVQTPQGPIAQTVIGDYKSSARKWPKTKSDAELAPSFYALREFVRNGQTEVPLVHEVILKAPTACRPKHGEDEPHPDESEACHDGKVRLQRFVTERGLPQMASALFQTIQFARQRVALGNDIDNFPPSPGYGAQNCQMCDFKDSCWLVNGVGSIPGSAE